MWKDLDLPPWSEFNLGRGVDFRLSGRSGGSRVPGHWEGDLVSGSSNTHIATLVERRSRFLVLVRVKERIPPQS